MRRVTLLRAALVLPLVLLLLGGRVGEADDPNELLEGDYAFSYLRSCVQTPNGGIDEGPPITLLEPALTRISTLEGTITYNGDGTATSVYKFRNMFHFPVAVDTGGVPVGGGTGTCIIDYTVGPDNSRFEQTLECEGITGDSGRTFEITGLGQQGRISQDGDVLLLFDTQVSIEAVSVFNPPPPVPQPLDRICIHNGSAVKIEDD